MGLGQHLIAYIYVYVYTYIYIYVEIYIYLYLYLYIYIYVGLTLTTFKVYHHLWFRNLGSIASNAEGCRLCLGSHAVHNVYVVLSFLSLQCRCFTV